MSLRSLSSTRSYRTLPHSQLRMLVWTLLKSRVRTHSSLFQHRMQQFLVCSRMNYSAKNARSGRFIWTRSYWTSELLRSKEIKPSTELHYIYPNWRWQLIYNLPEGGTFKQPKTTENTRRTHQIWQHRSLARPMNLTLKAIILGISTPSRQLLDLERSRIANFSTIQPRMELGCIWMPSN